jgi:hypothetical protein
MGLCYPEPFVCTQDKLSEESVPIRKERIASLTLTMTVGIYYFFSSALTPNALRNSIGSGKIIVLLLPLAISVRVER